MERERVDDQPALVLLDGVRWAGGAIPGERGDALLGVLAHAYPHSVSTSQLVAEVWADEPAHPDKALQVLVSRVRSRTDAAVIRRDGAGYRLGLREDQVDALRLRSAVAAAREAYAAGDLDVVRHLTRDALALAVNDEMAPGLEPLAAAARRDRADARRLLGRALLARGEHAEALPHLEGALQDAPTDEERLADVLRAEAEVRGVPAALARYAAYAEGTRDRLGAEPGEPLRRLHAELLAREAPVREGLKYDAAPMVGRDEDVAVVRGMLSAARVVSIVGAGGLGKTRMAHLVGRLAPQPAVHFVELAGVASAEGVLPEIGAALNVRDSVALSRPRARDTDLRRRIAERLGGGPTLLILDNCEHVVDAAADVVAYLVATTDTVTVLTTSRAPLGIGAEQVYQLPQLAHDEAVDLFERRARAARPGVRLAAGEVSGVVDRLDGLPLAIELAAAKVRVMSVADIGRRLGDRFVLLAGTDRSAPDRHRTLEAVIDWSWNLLRPADQAALRALSVFPDGFSLDGAEAVLGHDPLASIVELVDQSLLVVRESEEGLRYRFLETVREYGGAQLAAVGDAEAVRAALRRWAVSLSGELAARVFTPDQVETMRATRREVGNLSAIMRQALEAGDVDTLVPTLHLLGAYWTVEGEHLTVLGVTRSALDLLLSPPGDRGSASYTREQLLGVLTLLVTNEAIFTRQMRPEAVAALRELQPDGLTRDGASARMLLATGEQEGDDKLAPLLAMTEDDDAQVARLALTWVSQIYENSGELELALDAARRGFALCDGSDGPWTRALIASQIAGLSMQFGEWEETRRYAEVALPVMDAVGAAEDVLQSRSLIALADLAEGRTERARAAIEEIAADERSHRTLGWNVGLVGKAELALADGDVDAGLALYRASLDSDRGRILEHVDVAMELSPWAVYGEAVVVFAASAYDRRDEVTDLATTLREKLPRIFAEEGTVLDFPVAGCALLALSAHALTEPDVDPELPLRGFALAHRFGYQRFLPTMSWANVVRLAEGYAAGVLDQYIAEYADRPAYELLGEARRSVDPG